MKRLVVLLSALTMVSLIVSGAVFSADQNIAKGCQVSSSADVGYGTGDRLLTTLTDGVYTEKALWNQEGVLGWEPKQPVEITIDLRKDQTISGVSFSSICENNEWVQWPADIRIFTSADSKTWQYAGELISLSRKNGEPTMEGAARYRFTTRDLRARGRYVSLIVFPHMMCFFTDEIEVYGGSDTVSASPTPNRAIDDPMADALRQYFNSRIQYRLNSDAKAVREALSRWNISRSQKHLLNARLDSIEKKIPTVEQENSPSFRAILPINEVDTEIFSVYGSVMKYAGLPRFFAWKVGRYDLISPMGVPEKKPAAASISITMMKNEYRADSILFTNASDKPMNARLTLKGLPGGRNPEWLSIYAIPWTDTNLGIPVAAALVPAKYENGEFAVPIPAGMTSKIWLTVDSSKLQSGRYRGTLTAKSAGTSLSVPFDLHVSTVSMAAPRLSFTQWDYTFSPGRYAVTPGNINAAVAMMRSHFMDSPWAGHSDIELPAKESFDENGKLVKPLTFAGLDAWLKRWNGARHYLLFLNAPTSIAGCEMGTEAFNIRVGQWAKALGDHIRASGIKPEQFGIMIRDEPNVEALKVIIAWARPIREAVPGIIIFQDCNNSNAFKTPNEIQAHQLSDISCPEIGPFYRGGKGMKDFVSGLLAAKHQIWLYQCYGPARLLDPYQYNRMEAWHCFKYGATGMGMWAFADTGSFKDSWNEYTSAGPSYSPVYFKGDEVFSGIHYESSREGIEDYEYLSMLRDAMQDSRNVAYRPHAEQLLKETVDVVLGKNYVPNANKWTWNNDRSKADAYRLKVLALLEKMNLPSKSD